MTAAVEFVGRERELAGLRAQLAAAQAGRGGLALLIGEPGIGKTRLAEELARAARAQGALVLWGRCYEGEGAPAFWPWRLILRAYLLDREPAMLRAELGPGVAAIAQIVEEVRDQFPDLEEPAPLAPEPARFRLFDSIAGFLRRAARARPLVLILDDLHWADRPSLLLLEFLAPELRGARLLVVGTLRDEARERDHPLSQTLGALAREQVAEHYPLAGLAMADVAAVIALTAGLEPSPDLVAAVYQETDGNPFFVSEIVRLLSAEGRLAPASAEPAERLAIPPGVRAVLDQRLARLSPECQRLLTAAAVIGREFRLATLAPVTGLAGETLLAALDEALAARLVQTVPGAVGRYSFRHALIRETLADSLGTPERVRLHRQVGEALAALYQGEPGSHLAELAYHFGQAAPGGDVEKALTYARAAAEQATALLAYEEAARHYQLALRLLDLRERDTGEQRCDLLLALGEAQQRAGETGPARATFQQAAELARRLPSPERLARAARGPGGVMASPGAVDPALVGLLEEALATLGPEDSPLRARLLARLAMELYWATALERCDALSREAVALARRVGDRATLSFALNARRFAIRGPATLEERLAVAQELAQLAEAADDRELALLASVWHIPALLEIGEAAAANRAIAACAQQAQALRQPLYLWYAAVFRALQALMAGRLAEAESLAAQALAFGQRAQVGTPLVYYLAQLYLIRREQGRLAEIAAEIAALAERFPNLPILQCYLVNIDCALGRGPAATQRLERLAANDFATVPADSLWLGALTALAETCAALSPESEPGRRQAARLYERLRPYGERNVVHGVPTCGGAVARYLGLLATVLARWPEAERHFTAALQLNERLGALVYLAHTHRDYARMLLARGQRGDLDRARDLLTQALALYQEIDLPYRLAEARQLLAQLPPTAAPPAPADPAGLTEREREVLRLLAAGYDNRAIAESLVLSLRTVERHISNLYEKLGISGKAARAVAASYAHQYLGLRPQPPARP